MKEVTNPSAKVNYTDIDRCCILHVGNHTPQSSAELETHMRLSADGSDYQDQIALARNPTELIIHTRWNNLS